MAEVSHRLLDQYFATHRPWSRFDYNLLHSFSRILVCLQNPTRVVGQTTGGFHHPPKRRLPRRADGASSRRGMDCAHGRTIAFPLPLHPQRGSFAEGVPTPASGHKPSAATAASTTHVPTARTHTLALSRACSHSHMLALSRACTRTRLRSHALAHTRALTRSCSHALTRARALTHSLHAHRSSNNSAHGAYAAAGQTRTLAPAATFTSSARVSRPRLRRR